MNKPAKGKKVLLFIIGGTAVLLVTATLLILYFTVGLRFNKNDNPPLDYNMFVADAVLTDEQISQDKAELIHNLEITHPYFATQGISDYDEAKQNFSNADITTAEEFFFAAAEFLTVFKDLHTMTLPIFPAFNLMNDLSAFAEDGKWMIYTKGENQPAAELYAINGVLFEEIKQDMLRYFPQENGSTYTLWLGHILAGFMRKSGAKLDDVLTFTYKDENGDFFDAIYPQDTPDVSDSEDRAKNFEIMLTDNILHVRIRDLTDDGSFGDCIHDIKNAVSNGIKKVILDVRGAPGGSDGYAKEILSALGFKCSEMGLTIRYSEATAKYRGTWRKSGCVTVNPFKYRSENKNNIDLKVFCDEFTASAAMMIVNQCVYSDLGELIGRTPGQNTNFCGNALQFQLTNSKVVYTLPLSYSFFERDGQKAPDAVTVDVNVPPEADFMDYAVWK